MTINDQALFFKNWLLPSPLPSAPSHYPPPRCTIYSRTSWVNPGKPPCRSSLKLFKKVYHHWLSLGLICKILPSFCRHCLHEISMRLRQVCYTTVSTQLPSSLWAPKDAKAAFSSGIFSFQQSPFLCVHRVISLLRHPTEFNLIYSQEKILKFPALFHSFD